MITGIVIAYIVLLIIGGLIGFLKAGSKVSLIASVVSAAVLGGIYASGVGWRMVGVTVVQALLIVTFAMRLKKTGKFMPSGLMLVVTGLAIVLEWVVR